MKSPIVLICLFAILLTSCNGSSQRLNSPTSIITVEVTRIVQITTTPVPSNTMTPTPTLELMDSLATTVAEAIGTPIVASDDCYASAITQLELNSCAIGRREELEKQLAGLFKQIEERYQLYSQAELEKFQGFQSEWEDLSKRECEFQSGMILVEDNGSLHYKGGSMAVNGYNECMVEKYQARLREFQIQIFTFTHQ